MKKIYISGKITGMEEKAREIFEATENELRARGFEPVNPMKIPADHDKTWLSYMRAVIKALCDCESIYMLENWTESRGAVIEYELAKKLGFPVFYQVDYRL